MGARSESFCRHFGFGVGTSSAFWRYRDIVHLLLKRVGDVDLDCFSLPLSGTEPTQVLPGREEILEPAVIAHDAVDDASARAHDLGGQQNDCVQKAPELHLDQFYASLTIG